MTIDLLRTEARRLEIAICHHAEAADAAREDSIYEALREAMLKMTGVLDALSDAVDAAATIDQAT
jgi:hypothetical protein